MRMFFTLLLMSGLAWAQAAQPQAPAQSAPAPNGMATPAAAPRDPNTLVIPAGTKIPLTLAQAISTKNAREGDAVYAQTAFPFVLNDHILIPAGTYIQGKIMHTEHAGRSKKRAEMLIHFTTMIYPSGYTVMLPGSIDNTPGADNKGVKDSEGTIQQDKDTGKRLEDAAKGAAVGGTVGTIGGAAAGGLNGARYGGLAGIAGGIAWALLKHGPELKLDVGTSIEMEIQRDIPVDASRIHAARAQS
ncbi:MAG TPA: TrbI/VirB10 family protein [Candidatus Sulfotelmatobacter sp.]|nr:TrbI/VirB10 family protein [Candidatus Sulfotelmatobacter sp.]